MIKYIVVFIDKGVAHLGRCGLRGGVHLRKVSTVGRKPQNRSGLGKLSAD